MAQKHPTRRDHETQHPSNQPSRDNRRRPEGYAAVVTADMPQAVVKGHADLNSGGQRSSTVWSSIPVWFGGVELRVEAVEVLAG